MRKRYTIMVYARRNRQPCYKYVAEASVKPGKALDIAHNVAYDILTHEKRSGAIGIIEYRPNGAIVRILNEYGMCKFIVRKVAKQNEVRT